MRISDWSSDVCSSDLIDGIFHVGRRNVVVSALDPAIGRMAERAGLGTQIGIAHHHPPGAVTAVDHIDRGRHLADRPVGDRKSVVQGKSVAVRVSLVGARLTTKTNNSIYELKH